MNDEEYSYTFPCYIPADHEFMESITERTIFKYQRLDPWGNPYDDDDYIQIEDSPKDNYYDEGIVRTISQDDITVIKKVLEKNPVLDIEELEPSMYIDDDWKAVFFRDNERTNTMQGSLYVGLSGSERNNRIVTTTIHEIFGCLMSCNNKRRVV